jgi:hypothetical protein
MATKKIVTMSMVTIMPMLVANQVMFMQWILPIHLMPIWLHCLLNEPMLIGDVIGHNVK